MILITEEGLEMSAYPILEEIAKLGFLREYQLVQDEPGHVQIAVLGESPGEVWLEKVRRGIAPAPQSVLTLTFSSVEEFVISRSGKRNPVVQHVTADLATHR